MPTESLRSGATTRGGSHGARSHGGLGGPRRAEDDGAGSPLAPPATWPGGGGGAALAGSASCPTLPAALEARLCLDGDDDSVVSSVLDGQCDGSTVDQVAALRAVTTPHGTGATVYDPTDFEAIMAVLERGANPVGD